MKYLLDTSGWIEYLEGSNAGEKVNEFLEAKNNEIYVTDIIISEVISKVKRKNSNSDLAYDCLIKNSKIFEITPRVARLAGLLHAEKRKRKSSFGLIDAIIILSARELGAKLITKDNHFKGFKEAIII
ncbi:MAG: PIN domain-containing protein [Nanoarchaeota archaeon]|nr:PIN domain-containing protein [Nanoarchaeota archaeon]MBU1501259.1 PIN domain-containing protein [Nanoarchaeota archaeon]